MTAEHVILDDKLDDILSSAAPSVPQPIQDEYNADIPPVGTIEVGSFTVPSSKRLVIELISLQVPSRYNQNAYQVFVTTSIGSTPIKHPIGTIVYLGGAPVRSAPGSGIIESFPRTLYADPGTNVIFTVNGITQNSDNRTPVKVTFSGRLIDVP